MRRGWTRHARAATAMMSLVAAFCLCLPARAQDEGGQETSGDVITGAAEVVNADIIRIGTQRVILWGIDAPEPRQKCYEETRTWECYNAARRKLETLVSRGDVTCYMTGDPDPFGRRFGVCEIAGEDVNAEMVRAGLALAYTEQTDAYVDDQLEAITDQVGIWQLGIEFQEPWAFRQANTPGGYR